MLKKKKTTASGEPVMVQSVRRTRSRRMKFCVQRGLGALPSTSKAEGKITAGFFPLRAECINTGIACAQRKNGGTAPSVQHFHKQKLRHIPNGRIGVHGSRW